jgi:hypothetical protein
MGFFACLQIMIQLSVLFHFLLFGLRHPILDTARGGRCTLPTKWNAKIQSFIYMKDCILLLLIRAHEQLHADRHAP